MKKRKWLVIVLALAMVLTMMPAMAMADDLSDFNPVAANRISTYTITGVSAAVTDAKVVFTVDSKTNTGNWDQNSGEGSVQTYTYVGVYVDAPADYQSLKINGEGDPSDMSAVTADFLQGDKYQYWIPVAVYENNKFILFNGSRDYKLLLEWTMDNGSVQKEYVDITRNLSTDLENAIVAKNGSRTYETLQDAINGVGSSDFPTDSIIELVKDASLTEKVTIAKDITIEGNNNTITGQANDASINFEVQNGTFTIQNVNLDSFGQNDKSVNGNAVIKVPSGVSGTNVITTNVNFTNINRTAIDIRSGGFNITGGTINCAPTGTNLTKGISVGLGTDTVEGSINNVTINGSKSNSEDWSSAGIEIYNGATVAINGGSITGSEGGVHVDNYWGNSDTFPGTSTEAATATINDMTIDVTGNAVRVYNEYKDDETGKITTGKGTASVSITNSTMVGDIMVYGAPSSNTIEIEGTKVTGDVGFVQENENGEPTKEINNYTGQKVNGTVDENGTTVKKVSSSSGYVQQKTLTFDTNGGSKIDAVTANYGKTIVLADYTPKRSGYDFVGWYKDEKLTEKIEYAILDYDMTVYAKWSANGEPTEDADVETQIVLVINDKTAVVDGKAVTNDVAPLIVNGRTYTPARFVAESLGAKVDWNEATRTVTITKDDTSIVLIVDTTTAYVNGEAVKMDASAFIADGRTFTPCRFVAEQLGANVEWDEATRSITILK